MWNPIPRTPTSCALSTLWPPDSSDPSAPVPASGAGAFCFCEPCTRLSHILSCGGPAPAATLNGGTLSCAVVIVRTAAAAGAAAPVPETAGPSPCPPLRSCPGWLAAAPPAPAGRSTSPSPPSSGRARRRSPSPAVPAAPAAAVPAAVDPAPPLPGRLLTPISIPRGRAAGDFFVLQSLAALSVFVFQPFFGKNTS